MSAVQGGLAVNGTLVIVGAAHSMQVSPIFLLMGNRSIKGWYSGTSIDSQDALAFSARTGVRSMNEVYPLARVSEAYDRMMSGKARFRVVLTMGKYLVRTLCFISTRSVSDEIVSRILANAKRVMKPGHSSQRCPKKNFSSNQGTDILY